MIVVIAILACGVVDVPSTLPPPANLTETSLPPSVIPRKPRTATPTLLPLIPSPAADELPPSWVVDFSNPILAALSGQRPLIQDEFLNFDQGWFYFIPDSPKGPYYAHIQQEALLLQLPAENEKRDYWVYNPRLLRKNFVLSFEIQFLESQPADGMRFQFDQTSDRNVAFDLSKNQAWQLAWGDPSDRGSTTGTYNHSSPNPIRVLVIAHGEECAVHLDDAPLTYAANCRAEPFLRPSPWALTFHIIAEPGHVASVAMDNLKFWDLDEIPAVSEPAE